MLQPLRTANRFKVKSTSVPAPIGGLNSRDSVDNMQPLDAITLTNMFPTVGKITLRDGYSSFCTGVGSGDVETLIEHNAGSNRQLLAVGSNGTLYQINTGSAVSKKTGLSNGRFQTAAFNGRTLFVNGTDTPFSWDGSSAANLSITLSDSTSADSLKGVHVHKNRVYYFRGDEQKFYYSATVDTFQGNFTLFNLGLVDDIGGNLIQIKTLTIDGGEGTDDLIAFIMDSGIVLVYSGDNPSSGFSLNGSFRIAEPVNEIRGAAKFGGDVAVITSEGVVALSKVFNRDRIGTQAVALSEKIRGDVIAQVKETRTSKGWQIFIDPKGDKIFINFPTGNATDPYNQFVFNPIINAWCLFQNIPATVWGQFNNDVFFGGASGIVYKITGNADGTDAIVGDVATSFNYFGDRGSLKKFSSVAPMLEGVVSNISFSFGVAVDHEPTTLLDLTPAQFTTDLASWDEAEWDVEHWADAEGSAITQRRKVTNKMGRSISLRLKISSSTQAISFVSANYHILPGGPI